jgi:hypothetical protein
MEAILNALKGYKTYVAAISGILVALAALFEMIAPSVAVWILAINGFLTAAFLRAGIKTDAAT